MGMFSRGKVNNRQFPVRQILCWMIIRWSPQFKSVLFFQLIPSNSGGFLHCWDWRTFWSFVRMPLARFWNKPIRVSLVWLHSTPNNSIARVNSDPHVFASPAKIIGGNTRSCSKLFSWYYLPILFSVLQVWRRQGMHPDTRPPWPCTSVSYWLSSASSEPTHPAGHQWLRQDFRLATYAACKLFRQVLYSFVALSRVSTSLLFYFETSCSVFSVKNDQCF